MTDVVKMCDVIDNCTECPRYGDDCDGDKRTENIIKALPSADVEQGFRGGKIPPKEMLDGTVLIPKHQWIEMERELAELKEKVESADAVQGEWIYEGMPTCSICGKWIDVLQGTAKLNFCPNCGARMKGGDSE